jgi:large subunit ribosomal protein L6
MSKIGRKAIDVGSVKVEIKGQEIHFAGKKVNGVHVLPNELTAVLDEKLLKIEPKDKASLDKKTLSNLNSVWGLNRALLANKIKGAQEEFVKNIQITGLGFKAALSGSKVVFSLGYSHKIDYELPQGVSLEVDKTGQKLTFKSADRELVGQVCSKIRSFRPPEPYKGTGIQLTTEVIRRKAGKTKAAA